MTNTRESWNKLLTVGCLSLLKHLGRLSQRIRKFAWNIALKELSRGPWVTRYVMYREIESIRARLPDSPDSRVLAISRSANLVELLALCPAEVIEANYPDYDILHLDFADQSFDYVLSDQVLEHVEGSPQRAIDECYRVLKPGGIAVHTTCFINPIHEYPKDFWRFTPQALKFLHKNWSEIIECSGWGNPDVWFAVEDGVRFEGVPHAEWHPLHKVAIKNDLDWPITTWIVARK